MNSEDIRRKFLEFFEKRGHKIVPSSSLIPDDPSVLLTTAGMQQFKRYFTGELDAKKDFRLLNGASARGAASIQKCFRTSDIDEVGDERHLTFFEMMGHFSFGEYFKKETIKWTYELLTDVFNIDEGRIRATVFGGDESVPFDEESFNAWSEFLPAERIGKGSRLDNFWGPAGAEGPCGAANEAYVDDIEIATLVFMEYYCAADHALTKLSRKGVDVGWGLERLAMVSQGAPTIFETDLFAPLVNILPENMPERTKRILADHARGIAFLVSDGVRPSNKEAGYVLRRLIRRVIVQEYLTTENGLITKVLGKIVDLYRKYYPELNKELILSEFGEENAKFRKTLKTGLKELEKINSVDAAVAFKLYESYGLPFEVIKEVAAKKAAMLTREGFDEEFKKHQEISRAGAEKKFGGHGLVLDTGELKAGSEEEIKKVTRLHTATHLLNRALHDVFGDEVMQRGSDITSERARFDFSFSRKMTPEEIKKVEDLVNQKIREDLPVNFVELPKAEAEKTGALHFFKGKYPEKVKVYYIGKDLKSAWSKEFCGGPHVSRTGEIGKFKIAKEESSSSGIRRIRAVVE